MEELKFLGKLQYMKYEATGENTYNVMKRDFPFGFQRVATLVVVPGISFEITAVQKLSPNDVDIIRRDAKELAGLSSKRTQTTIY